MAITDRTRRREQTVPDKEKLAIASGNHIWVNAFSAAKPSERDLRELGQMVLNKLLASEVCDDLSGTFPVTWIRINAS